MIIAAGLAGGGVYFHAKASIEERDFNRSIQLIVQDDDATWCSIANGQNVKANDLSWFCAIAMPEYQVPEEEPSAK